MAKSQDPKHTPDELKNVLRQVVKTMVGFAHIDAGGIYLVDEDSGDLDLAFSQGLSPEFVAATSHYDADSPSARLIMECRPIYRGYQELNVPIDEVRRSEGLRAVALIPVLHEKRVIACINIASNTVDEIPQDIRDALEVIASLVGGFISQVQTREALNLAEKQLRQITDNMVDMIVLTDANMRLTYVSPSHEKVRGFSPDEILGSSVMDRVHPEDLLTTQADIAKSVLSREPSKTELRIRHKDGHYLWVESIGNPLYDNKGDLVGFVFTSRDIIERKQVEEQLLESQARLSKAQRIAHIGNWNMDLNTREMYWSEEAYRIFDVDPQQQQISYKMLLDAIHPEDRAFVDRAFSDSVMERKPFDFAHRLKTMDGKIKHVSIQGEHLYDESDKPIRTIGTIQDISKQVMVRQILEKNERRYRLLAENSSDVIWTMDLEGNYTYVSPSMERLSGYSPEEVMNRPMGTSMTPRSKKIADTALAEFIEAYRRGESSNLPDSYELEQICKDGSVIWTEIVVNPIADEQNNLQGILGVTRDITRRVRLEEQFRQSAKMEAVGRLAGGVAHDFNNLLTVIQSSVGFALEAAPKESELRDDLLDIQTTGKRAEKLTRQLLAFSRRQLLQPKVLDINTLVGSMEKMLSLVGEDIDLKIIPGRNVGKVRADPGQIEQVIMNLAVNARDAMPKGGRLTIETAEVEIDKPSLEKSMSLEPGSYVMIAVSDNGTGMDSETCSRVFDPFFTTKKVGKGTGLGLSTTHGIVKQSGGDIRVDSKLGEGTTFSIYLPRLERDTILDLPSTTPKASVAGGDEVILVVEDSEAVRNLTVRILEKQGGYTVLQADGLTQALKVSEQSGGPIDLLLTDVVMPGASGREVAEILVGIHAGLKVLYMSGYTDDDILRHGVSTEKVAFIQKPFNADSLCNVVREILDAPNGAVGP